MSFEGDDTPRMRDGQITAVIDKDYGARPPAPATIDFEERQLIDHHSVDSSDEASRLRRVRLALKIQFLCAVLLLATTLGNLFLFIGVTSKAPAQPAQQVIAASPMAILVKDQEPTNQQPDIGPTVNQTEVEEFFQLYQPVFTPEGATDSTVDDKDGDATTSTIGDASSGSGSVVTMTLMVHDFANSYGNPFVASYTPPDIDFNRVTINFTMAVKGRQYDRLALMYFNDTEVWRTSTAEPTTVGIVETYVKDMSEFLYFWKQPQTLVFDLPNVVTGVYTGILNTTLTATFFTSQDTVAPADLILPISRRLGSADMGSVFMIPNAALPASNTIDFPQNVNRAVFTISACGQAAEEFWWSNTLSSAVETFEDNEGTLYGFSSFREVQVLIDGTLAGVQWPFPVIFTGGVVPGLWRPIVGIDAYDLREHEIDITPWLPILCDGNEHTFDIIVTGLNDTDGTSAILAGTTGDSWYVTGKIFIWLDEDETSVTTGTAPTILLPAPVISVSQSFTQNSTGANETLTYTQSVSRTLSISSHVNSQNSSSLETWTQTLSFANTGIYSDYGQVQWVSQNTTGNDQRTGSTYYQSKYNYPIVANTTFLEDEDSGNYTIMATIDRGLDLAVYGTSVFPTGLQPFALLPASSSLISKLSGSQLSTTQNGIATYFSAPNYNTSATFGSTQQDFVFSGLSNSSGVTDTELYSRSVKAVNSTLVYDHESLVGEEVGSYEGPESGVGGGEVRGALIASPRGTLGRGPGVVRGLMDGMGGGL